MAWQFDRFENVLFFALKCSQFIVGVVGFFLHWLLFVMVRCCFFGILCKNGQRMCQVYNFTQVFLLTNAAVKKPYKFNEYDYFYCKRIRHSDDWVIAGEGNSQTKKELNISKLEPKTSKKVTKVEVRGEE